MLAPEVLNMPPPRSDNIVIENDSKRVSHAVCQQYFNHSVSFILPDTLNPPDSLLNALSGDSGYYHIADLPGFELVNLQFIKLFIKTGAVTLHSVNTRLDQDDCVAINPCGILIFSLTSNTFQKLGLEGKKSEYVNGRFVVKLDLKSELFSPGSKRYRRVLECLKATPELIFSVVLAWEPLIHDVCPSSIAAWFSEGSYCVKSCSNQFCRNTVYDAKVPNYQENCLFDLQEWVGMIHLQCDTEPEHSGLSMYQIPSPFTCMGQVVTLQWIGFLTAAKVSEACKRLKLWVDSRSSSAWVAMAVHGLEDSVTTHGDKEHHFYVDGDYSITVFMRPAEPSSALVHVSSARSPVGRKRRGAT